MSVNLKNDTSVWNITCWCQHCACCT